MEQENKKIILYALQTIKVPRVPSLNENVWLLKAFRAMQSLFHHASNLFSNTCTMLFQMVFFSPFFRPYLLLITDFW